MRLFKKVAVIGAGLIGGSIALAIKKKKLADEVVGVTRHRRTLLLAKKIGAIDRGAQDLSIVRGADLVIFATPVKTILGQAKKVSRLIKKDCLVTDVGSTKKEIVAKLERIFPGYVGTHPLAGSEKRSVINADPGLFKGSLCIVTPTKNTCPQAKRKIEKLWRNLGAKMLSLPPAGHDKALSFVSHLPHAVAFSLIGTVPGQFLKFAASGLKDTTRIAASDAHLWADIFLSNKDLPEAIDKFTDNLARIKSAIRKKDKNLLSKILKTARDKRKSLG